MATLTIRNIDDSVKTALRLQAAKNGHSMEEEARQILRRTVLNTAALPQFCEKDDEEDGENLAMALRRIFHEAGVYELDIPPRDEYANDMRRIPTFD